MRYSIGERIAHVFRRLGMGPHPTQAARVATPDGAIAAALDLGAPPVPLPEMEAPLDRETARDIATLADPIDWWLSAMVTSSRPIEERMTWFWHDHFATAVQKVRIPYLLWGQLSTIRSNALGSFEALVREMARDPAMLLYLDGARSHARAINENHARELMELHTLGAGNYTQEDVFEVARALTGWVVVVPYARQADRFLGQYEPWESAFISRRHDPGPKTILGRTGELQLDDVIDLLLEEPATARHVVRKLWAELVGTDPEPGVVDDLAASFARDYSIIGLVSAIAATPEFLSDEAVRSKVRNPVERLVAVAQGLGGGELPERGGYTLHGLSYLPFNPPSPAGFPKGEVLLGPHRMVHYFDLAAAAESRPGQGPEELMASLGVIDASEATLSVLSSAADDSTRTALALNSPEFALT